MYGPVIITFGLVIINITEPILIYTWLNANTNWIYSLLNVNTTQSILTYTIVKCKYNPTYTNLYYSQMQIQLNLY